MALESKFAHVGTQFPHLRAWLSDLSPQQLGGHLARAKLDLAHYRARKDTASVASCIEFIGDIGEILASRPKGKKGV